DVHGSTLGILGMGRIGQAIARRGHHGFGMRVLYHNRSRLPEDVERGVGARYVDLDTLLAQADHLLLVLPYSPASHHIIDAAALAKMKPTATLVKDRKSTRLNSSHVKISYAVFCLKKKRITY